MSLFRLTCRFQTLVDTMPGKPGKHRSTCSYIVPRSAMRFYAKVQVNTGAPDFGVVQLLPGDAMFSNFEPLLVNTVSMFFRDFCQEIRRAVDLK